MPSIEAAIESRAVAFSGLTALIGTVPTRLYPTQAAQGATLPYVTYQVVSAPRPHVMSADKEEQPRVQFDVWASTWASARSVRDQVKACFDRWSGTFASTVVDASVCENGGITIEPEEPSLTPRITLEFTMTYRL